MATMNNNSMENKVMAMKPKIIDPSKCTLGKSLHQQVLRYSRKTLQHQTKQFNLGNGQIFTDPITAADYLLQREYGDSSLVDNTKHECVFIPPVFCSNQYTSKSAVPLLDYEFEKTFLKTLANLSNEFPNHWFTEQLKTFVQQQGLSTDDAKQINAADFDKWVLNFKMSYLVDQELHGNEVNLPPSTSETNIFIQGCIAELNCKKPGTELEATLQNCLQTLKNVNGKKVLKRGIEKLIEQKPCTDSTMLWYFKLVLSHRGEAYEQMFFDKLLSMREETLLNDTVILQSVCFLTDVSKKKHQEFDLIIFSWPRKLVIGIEIKRQLNDTAFNQIEKYHTLFQERLGDQFGADWTFFPVICVGENTLSFESQHYININTDIELWLSSIFKRFPEKTVPIPFLPSAEHLIKILRLIIFAVHISKKDQIAPITTTNWVKYISDAIDTLCTSHNILFHSKEQLPAFIGDHAQYTKLLIKGGLGAGKTHILKQRAIMLSKDPQFNGRVLFVVIENFMRNSLLYFQTKHELQTHGIIVENVIHIKTLEVTITTKGIKALFFDECNYVMDETKKTIEHLSTLVDVMWIAPDAYCQDININDFTTIHLKNNLRNTKEIVFETKRIAEETSYRYKSHLNIPPPIFPQGCQPIYTYSIEEALDKARELTKEGILVIDSSTPDDYHEYVKSPVGEWVKQKMNTSQVSLYDHLLNGGILVAKRWNIDGFEWPTIIVNLTDKKHRIFNAHECNFCMRCTTNLFIVKKRN